MKYTEAILWNGTRKLLWFEITKMLIAVLENKFIVLVIIIFGRLSSSVGFDWCWSRHRGHVTSVTGSGRFFLGGGQTRVGQKKVLLDGVQNPHGKTSKPRRT